MALVEFKHVEKYYGDYHALRDINLRFEKGQVVVLLGPSGSGKSTLIRTINGLAGFAVGVAEKSEIIDGSNVAEGDVLLGLASSGIHSKWLLPCPPCFCGLYW